MSLLNRHHPFFPHVTALGKGFSDVISLKPITNPIGHLKDTAQAFKGGGITGKLDALAIAGGVGKGVLPSVINDKAKGMLGGTTEAQRTEQRERQTLLNKNRERKESEIAAMKQRKSGNLLNLG